MRGADQIEFREWRERFRRALQSGAATDVPCGGCTACCRSYQFVHIEPDEAATLARIDPALLAPAPGKPPGHVVMGYDGEGRCPMLGDDGCRIYEDRPRTCRTYDCRVFAATGIEPDQPLVAERVRQWKFGASVARTAVAERAGELRRAGAGATEAAVRAASDERPGRTLASLPQPDPQAGPPIAE